ncbi:MAG: hypothetical protein ACI8RZ_003819 [Myxococcota bacterium]|jgi:hypothetical protein
MSTALDTLLTANQDFYTAFESMTYSQMATVWAQRPEDCCTHPGWDTLRGWREIRESWRAIFAGTEFVRIEVTKVSAEIQGTVGRVVCVENLLSVVDRQAVHSQVACTNLFLLTDEGWKLTLHHGSPIASQPVMAAEVDLDVN